MPEGDVVWRAAQRLQETLGGARLTVSDFRVPYLATADLSGRRVAAVVARGKHLLARMATDASDPRDRDDSDRPKGSDSLTLHTHLGMDGEWRLYRAGSATRGPHADIRVLLDTSEWRAAGYRLPVVELLATGEEWRAVGHLGPDLLGPDWNEPEALQRLSAAPGREVAEALLDQRNLAGIGNLYKCEALFLSGISPWRSVGAVADLPRLVRLARRLLLANRDRAGQVTTGVARRGEETWVYGRGGRPCRRCGALVERLDQGQAPEHRLTFWCPHCQR